MPLRPTTRDIIILFGFLLFLVQFGIAFRSSGLSRSVYRLGVKLWLAHDHPEYAAYESEIAPGSNEHVWENQTLSTRVRWEMGGAPKTAIVAHAPGMSYCIVFVTGLP